MVPRTLALFDFTRKKKQEILSSLELCFQKLEIKVLDILVRLRGFSNWRCFFCYRKILNFSRTGIDFASQFSKPGDSKCLWVSKILVALLCRMFILILLTFKSFVGLDKKTNFFCFVFNAQSPNFPGWRPVLSPDQQKKSTGPVRASLLPCPSAKSYPPVWFTKNLKTFDVI